MAIHNMMEDFVYDMLEKQWDHIKLDCHCAQCKEDVLALALNHVPPHYVSNQAGGAYIKAQFFSEQSSATILTAIVEAAQKVSNKPRHAPGSADQDA